MALARDSRSSAALYIRSRLYRQQVDEDFAPAAEATARWGEAVRTLVELDPNFAWGHMELGNWYDATNGPDGMVLAELDRAADLAPDNPRVLEQVAERLPWLGQPKRAAELLDHVVRLDPAVSGNWRQYQVGFFLRRFRQAADLIGSFSEFSRRDYLFATLSHAELGDMADMARWRTRFLEIWPDYSWEHFASETGDFSRAAAAERALWWDSHTKASLPLCATPEQVARLGLRPLAECESQRAKAAGPPG